MFFKIVFNAYSSGDHPDVVEVGKISFSPAEVLGHGTEGTFVFRWVIMDFNNSLVGWLFFTFNSLLLYMQRSF